MGARGPGGRGKGGGETPWWGRGIESDTEKMGRKGAVEEGGRNACVLVSGGGGRIMKTCWNSLDGLVLLLEQDRHDKQCHFWNGCGAGGGGRREKSEARGGINFCETGPPLVSPLSDLQRVLAA